LDRGRDALGRRDAVLVRAAAPRVEHAHAFLFLRQVDKLKIGRERLEDPARLGQRQAVGQRKELIHRLSVRGRLTLRPLAFAPAGLCQAAHSFDPLEERPAFLFDDGFAEQISEQVDVLAQAFLGFGHDVRLPQFRQVSFLACLVQLGPLAGQIEARDLDGRRAGGLDDQQAERAEDFLGGEVAVPVAVDRNL